jgi:predicted nuclease of predicted toxin-antitoxin system
MNVLADENIPLMTVARLRELGHDVEDIRRTGEQGLPDPELWALALTEGRMLITTSKGITERHDAKHSGILVVCLRQPNRHKIHHAVIYAMERFLERQWPGLLVVMQDQTMRVSRQPR